MRVAKVLKHNQPSFRTLLALQEEVLEAERQVPEEETLRCLKLARAVGSLGEDGKQIRAQELT
eukprot:5941780-Amphidinium_carterae.1